MPSAIACCSCSPSVAGNCMRRADLFGRLGGEEFAALLVDVDARAGARRRRRHPAPPLPDDSCEVDGRPVVATVSIGIVISYDAVLDISALLAQADHALYRAKDNGRNRIEIASIELILDRAKRGTAEMHSGMSAAKSAARSAA